MKTPSAMVRTMKIHAASSSICYLQSFFKPVPASSAGRARPSHRPLREQRMSETLGEESAAFRRSAACLTAPEVPARPAGDAGEKGPMAPAAGLEPATARLGGGCSVH